MSAASDLSFGQPFEKNRLFGYVFQNAPRWSTSNRRRPEISCRILPVNRVREHANVGKNWVPVINELMTAKLTASEIAVLLTLLLLRPKQHPNRSELRDMVSIKYKTMCAALNSLVRRQILFFDLVDYAGGKKEIWHIASPHYWKIDGFRNAAYKAASVDPGKWSPRKFSSAPEDGRLDEYSSTVSSSKEYGKAPRVLINIDISQNAKRIWLYLASLRQTWHPTVQQIVKAVRLSKPTVTRGLEMLEDAGMIVSKDYRHPRFRTNLERTYHTVHPAFWRFEGCSSLPSPAVSILQNPAMIEYLAEGKKWKRGASTASSNSPESKKWKRQRVKNGNARESNLETQKVSFGNAEGQTWKHTSSTLELGVQGETESGQVFHGDFSPCDNIPCENIHSENIPGEEESRQSAGGRLWIYNSKGNPSRHITHLVADHVEYAFQDKSGKVYPHRLNLWIADFAERAETSLGSVDQAFIETRAFCEFIAQHYSGQRFYARHGSFREMEAAWRKHKTGPAAGGCKAESARAQEGESQNPALEYENLAHSSCSMKLPSRPPALEILPLVPTEQEREAQCPILSPEPQSFDARGPAKPKPADTFPTDPDRLQWLITRIHAKARRLQKEELRMLWAKKPSIEALGPMIRFFCGRNAENAVLVDSARMDLDAMGILRKADIPPLPWTDSGELAPTSAPAAAPKQPSAGDGTLPLPLTRDRLKRALRKLNLEQDLWRRFEIDGWFMAIEGDQQLHAEMLKKYGADAVEGALHGNH